MSPGDSVVISIENGTAGGRDVILMCTAQGGPNNSYVWMGPLDYMTNDSFDGNTLVIMNLTAESGGDYVCMVTNEAGSGMDMVTVNGRFTQS